jgi:hypothetical protein
MNDAFTAGQRFLLSQARLLERRLFETCFRGAPPSGVVNALRGYQNDDGGFGHALEPDKRCPASLPIDVEVALQALVTAGTTDREMVGSACDYLAAVAAHADAGGAVSPAFPVIESYPRAVHWSDWTYEPGLNPTAGLVGRLYQLGVDHPWMADGARYCWATLAADGLPTEAHALAEVLVFLDHTPERGRADDVAAGLPGHLAAVPMLQLDPEATGYGLSPLQFAATPTSPWRALFTEAQIDGHLDKLGRQQQPDGGWPLTWEPPSEASTLDFRGVVTLEALRTLTAYGRLDAASGQRMSSASAAR